MLAIEPPSRSMAVSDRRTSFVLAVVNWMAIRGPETEPNVRNIRRRLVEATHAPKLRDLVGRALGVDAGDCQDQQAKNKESSAHVYLRRTALVYRPERRRFRPRRHAARWMTRGRVKRRATPASPKSPSSSR